MDKQLVYDLPTRLFHWLFAFLFTAAFIIAKTIDDDSSYYPLHMLMGLSLGFITLLRIIWGFIGSKHAKFSDFALKPIELVHYLKSAFLPHKVKHSGHNPASSWAAILMMICTLGLVTTGILMTSTNLKEAVEDAHELFANIFALTVFLHIAGIALHTVTQKDLIGLSMVDGKKSNIPSNQAISNTQPLIALVFLILVLSFGFSLYKNYDLKSKSLKIAGFHMQLGEDSEKESQEREPGESEDED
jgi:cytochrome b